MKKSLLILFSAILIGIQPVMAKNVKVQSMSNFSTANPSQTLDLKIVDGMVNEPLGGAHKNIELMAQNLKNAIIDNLNQITNRVEKLAKTLNKINEESCHGTY